MGWSTPFIVLLAALTVAPVHGFVARAPGGEPAMQLEDAEARLEKAKLVHAEAARKVAQQKELVAKARAKEDELKAQIKELENYKPGPSLRGSAVRSFGLPAVLIAVTMLMIVQ